MCYRNRRRCLSAASTGLLAKTEMNVCTITPHNLAKFFPTASLLINACSSIQTVNMMQNALSQTALTLTPVDETPFRLLNQYHYPHSLYPPAARSASFFLLVRKWNVHFTTQNIVGLTPSAQGQTAHFTIQLLLSLHAMP